MSRLEGVIAGEIMKGETETEGERKIEREIEAEGDTRALGLVMQLVRVRALQCVLYMHARQYTACLTTLRGLIAIAPGPCSGLFATLVCVHMGEMGMAQQWMQYVQDCLSLYSEQYGPGKDDFTGDITPLKDAYAALGVSLLSLAPVDRDTGVRRKSAKDVVATPATPPVITDLSLQSAFSCMRASKAVDSGDLVGALDGVEDTVRSNPEATRTPLLRYMRILHRLCYPLDVQDTLCDCLDAIVSQCQGNRWADFYHSSK
ncbi:hypothetical protein KIPB_005840 [Kipferlia bialata]|uniref:Uncharacterized protein n=1 Tax=Kipferlia bialata TaxID=797122 RepID=A0A9K3CZ64_9EUKA|nr:hypothetical protein KIPB_005840 [Kipferlia bialata]|eukprot:g5840.t1